ncbi:MAG: hypothetical protein LBL80_03550, partial [Ruminococcus sp.]|nr:hypothetical protein [Ruminococcus sp.]
MDYLLLTLGIIIIVLLAAVIILLLRKKQDNIDISKLLSEGRKEQLEQLSTMQHGIQTTLFQNADHINVTIENRIKSLQESNEKRLSEIQGIVDEKLQKTLNDRLSQSFEMVTKQLESVGQGLGEMKTLAADAKSL